MNRSLYVIGSEPLHEWEQKNGHPSCITITGSVSTDTFEQLVRDFDYTKYKQITLTKLTVEDFKHGNDYTCTYKEHLSYRVCEDGVKLAVLIKLYLNTESTTTFVVSDGRVFTENGETLVHIPENHEVIIPLNVKHIGNCACCGYDKMSRIKLNDGLKSIGEWAFVSADINMLEMPDSVVSVGKEAFLMAEIEKVKLSKSLVGIPDGCFDLCSLEKIEIPSSVRYIGDRALRGLIWADEIEIPEGVEKIGYDVFEAMYHVSLPSTLKDIAPDFYYEECIDSPEYPPYIDLNPNNEVFYSKDGSLYFKKDDTLALDHAYNGPNECCIRFQNQDSNN